MYNFHSDADRYFEIQRANCAEHVIPFIEEVSQVKAGGRVLEIGCGSAGVLMAFLERGCTGVGIDISEQNIEFAKKKLAGRTDAVLLAKDIYEIDIDADLNGKFDIIVLKDVIEHIPNQERLIARLKNMLRPNGLIFFGFPPWQMPFGGHQQVLQSRVLSRTPYLHLLPMPVYKRVMRIFNSYSEEHVQIKQTGISIERFERIAKNAGYRVVNRQFHLVNPIYKYRLGLKMRKQWKLVSAIPYVRNFLTTSVFYLIKPV
jgi:SAM-dependent methyltransferase